MKHNVPDRRMLGAIFALAWPTMLEELMQTAVQYFDTAMVGALGTRATAAVGATGAADERLGGPVLNRSNQPKSAELSGCCPGSSFFWKNFPSVPSLFLRLC